MRRALADLGLSGDTISDSVLAVSELVANAHEHAHGPYEVHLRSAAGRYICEIYDRDPALPADLYLTIATSRDTTTARAGAGSETLSEPLLERGRGLLVVHELAKGQWGFRVTRHGTKAAWVVLATVGSAS
ncbi:hypothetical protein LK08_28430 [Streptomyces sp. MUSC 125]|nr:hypothetical protein LK08_28430 [Streptomyces sp. MUSC 125]